MTLLLGIDIGTSSAKAVLFDPETAQIVGVAGEEYPIHHPAPDRAEQHPDDWWNAAVAVTRRALAEAGRAADEVAAIGFSGQMHGATLIGKNGSPAAPAIIWADQRSGGMAKTLTERLDAATYTQIAGTMPAAGFTSATLAWLVENDPGVLRRSKCVVMPKDYVRYKMTGELATDMSDAAGTAMFDIALKAWSPEIVGAVGVSRQLLPDVKESSEIVGQLTADAAQKLGLPAGVVVVAGSADQPAQAVGNGLIAPGQASITVGSGGQVFTPIQPMQNGEFHPIPTDPRLHVFNHAVYNTWYILGAILSAGLSLRWLRGITGLNGRADAYETFSAEAAPLPPGANGLLFLPYLTGERTPYMDADARGAFIGLSAFHERGHLARAVMEGVAFALRQSLEISQSLGGEVDTIIAGGGGMESDVWRGILADVLGLPLRRTAMVEQAGVGAALLAGVGVGVYPTVSAAANATVRYGVETLPDMERHAQYDELYARFTELYPRLKDDFHFLTARATG